MPAGAFCFEQKRSTWLQIMNIMNKMSKTIKMQSGGRSTLKLTWNCTQCMGGLNFLPLNTGGIFWVHGALCAATGGPEEKID